MHGGLHITPQNLFILKPPFDEFHESASVTFLLMLLTYLSTSQQAEAET